MDYGCFTDSLMVFLSDDMDGKPSHWAFLPAEHILTIWYAKESGLKFSKYVTGKWLSGLFRELEGEQLEGQGQGGLKRKKEKRSMRIAVVGMKYEYV